MTTYTDINATGTDFVVDTISGIAQNLLVGNTQIFGIGLLIAITFITFAVSKVIGFEKSLSFSTFLGVIISIFFANLGYINSKIVYLFIGLFAISLFFLMKSGEEV